MKRTFVETTGFRERVDYAGGSLQQEIQQVLLENLTEGTVIPGTGGIRKMRHADKGRGKGKRGGYRVLYLDIPEVEKTYLLALYDKDEKGDISAGEKKVLRELVQQLKQAARLK